MGKLLPQPRTLSGIASHPQHARRSPIGQLRAMHMAKAARRMRLADPPPIPSYLLGILGIPNFTLPVPQVDPTQTGAASTIQPADPPFVPTAGDFAPWPPTPVT